MGKLFGTDGIRGVARTELTTTLAYQVGKSVATALGKGDEAPLMVVGMDTRESCDELSECLISGIQDAGGNAMNIGVITTPAVAYMTVSSGAAAGFVISASHNPYQYNGIKVFGPTGFKLPDQIENDIEEIIAADEGIRPFNDGYDYDDFSSLMSAFSFAGSAKNSYIAYLLEIAEKAGLNGDLGLSIVLDCANGAAYDIAPEVYSSLGAELTITGVTPDGKNINENCGSTHPETLSKIVLGQHADIGLAFDGDADRLIACDEKGRILDGDKILAILANYLKKQGKLEKNIVTTTVMANAGFHETMGKLGIKVEVTSVGDRHVLESMQQTGSVLGGEQSGHIIFLDHATTGDGILSSIMLVAALKESGKKLSELADEVIIYPQVLVNARIDSKRRAEFDADEEMIKAIAETEAQVKKTGAGRVLIRHSGTEPLVRVMIEGEDEGKIKVLAENLAKKIEEKYFN